MFELVVRTVLNKFLGDYVSNLEANQLNVGLFSGNVVLNGLKLKREALDKLDLPITVYDGYLGKLELHIPWTNLKGQPVVVQVSDLYLLAGPKVDSAYDPVAEAERAYKAKLERLETHDLFTLSNSVVDEDDDADQAKTESFTTQLVTKIVDNLQITIQNIHIRFEDNISHPDGRPFSFGITLEQLSAVSTDENWEEAFIAEAVDRIHKLLNLESFSMYWDSQTGVSLKGLDTDAFLAAFKAFIRREENRTHVLRPITGCGKVVINKRRQAGEAKTLVNLFFDQFALFFDNDQYYDLLTLVNFFVSAERYQKYGDLRPVSRKAAEDPLGWFRYAVNCNLRDYRERARKLTWRYVLERRRDRLEYIGLFIQKLQAPDSADPELHSALGRLERKIGYEDLKVYRSFARNKWALIMRKQKEAEAASAQASRGWFSWLLAPAAPTANPTTIAEMINADDIRQLYETIDFDEQQRRPASPSGAGDVRFQLNFDLGTGSLNIGQTSAKGDSVDMAAELVFKLLSGSVIKRKETVRFEVSLQELSLLDGLLKGTLFPAVIRSRPTKYEEAPPEAGEKPFFYLAYDQLCQNSAADSSLTLLMQPLVVVLNHQAAQLLRDFFVGGRNADLLGGLSGIAEDQLSELRLWTKSSLEETFRRHKAVDLHVEIEAPILVVPKDCTDAREPLFVADLGHVRVQSRLVSTEQRAGFLKRQATESLSRLDLHSMKELLYDQFELALTQVQINYFRQLAGWTLMNNDAEAIPGECRVIEKIDLGLDIGSCILPSNAELPSVVVKGRVPSIGVQFSDEKYNRFMDLIDIFFPSKNGEAEAAMLGKTPASAFYVQQNISSIISLPNTAFRQNVEIAVDTGETGTDDDEEEEEEFMDAVESLEDLKILERAAYDRVSVELSFVVEQVKGHIVNHKADDKDIGEIVVENVKVIVEVHPSDISVKVLLKSFDVTDYLDGPGRQLVEGSGEEEGLLRVNVSLVDVDHPLFHSKYKSAGIFVDIDISSVTLTLCPPAIMYILRYVADTFSRAQNRPAVAPPARTKSLQRSASAVERRVGKLARAASTASKLAKPDALVQAESSLSKIFVNVKLSLLRVYLHEQQNQAIGTLNLQRAALCISLFGTGKLLMQGKLASLALVPQSGLSEAYSRLDGITFLRVEGDSVVDFTYETFLRDAKDFPGHDVGLALKSGSMHFCYLPAFLLRLASFGIDLRRAASDLLASPQGDRSVVHDANQEASRFHYRIDIDSPRIDLCSPRSPEERVSLFPGNLSIANSFRDDDDDDDEEGGHGLFDTLIDIAVRSVHVDIAHFPRPGGAHIIESSLIEPVDVDVRVLQAHDALSRGRAPIEVAVGCGPVRIAAAETEYTLFMGILHWFVAANPAVIARLNEFLAAGGPPSTPSSPILEEAESLDKNNTLTVHVLADTIQANIFRYRRTRSSDAAPAASDPISLLMFSDFTLDYAAKGSGDYSVEMAVKEAALHDTRVDPARAFRQVLRRTDETAGGERHAPMIRMSYEYVRAAAGQTVSKIALDSPQLLLVLDHLFAMRDFFVGGAPQKPLVVLPAAGNTDTGMAGPAKTAPVPQAYFFTFQAIRASVLVLENPANPLSEAMELSLPQLVFTDSTGFQTVTAHDVRGAFCNMNDIRGTRLSFLEPLDVIGATEKQQNAGGAFSSRMTLNVTPVVFRVAYQDIAVFASLYRQYLDLNKPAEPDAEGVEAETGVEGVEEAFRRLSAAPSLESLLAPPNLSSELRISLNIGSIRAVFVDDFSKTNRPLVEVLLDAVQGDYNMLAGCTTGQFRGRLSSTYFNLTNSHWEPLVEPVPLALDLVQDPQEDANRNTVMGSNWLVSSGEGLELVVSHAFAELLLRLSANLAASGQTVALSALRESSQAYLVVNETGSPITIWASRSKRRRQSLSITAADTDEEAEEVLGRATVAPGKAVPWGYQDWRSLRSSRESLDVRVACRLEDSPWELVRGIVVDRVGSSVYNLRPRIEEAACRLVVQVGVTEADAAGGIKRIVFRPTITFANDTKYPLEVQLLNEGGDGGFGEAPISRIEPGGCGSFPLTLVRPGMRVRGRPCGLGYGWSESVIPIDANLVPRAKRKAMKPPVQMACSHLTDPILHPAFHFTLFASEESSSSSSKASAAKTPTLTPDSAVVLTVHFRAPFQLMNQLPLAISYRIYDKTAGFDFGGALIPGDTAQLHFVNAAHVIGLALQVDQAGLGSSQISLVNSPEDWEAGDSERDDRLPCVDSERLRMDLRLAYQLKKQVIRRVIVWAPYVIYSLFGPVPLAIRNNTIVRANRDVPGVTRMNEANATEAAASPLLFAYPESIALRERVRIRLGDSEWSRPLSMETVGAVDCVDLHDAAADVWHNVGMSVRLGPAKYQPTKVVHFGPRYIFCNETALQLGIGFDRLELCEAGQRVPFGVAPQHRRQTAIGVLAEASDTLRTAAFDVDEMGKVYLKTGTGLLRVDRILQGAFVFVLVREETLWPYELVNNSSMDLLYSQSTTCSVLPPEALLPPGQTAHFAWDDPSAPDKKLMVTAGSKRLPVDIHDIGQLQPVSVRLPGGVKKSLAIDVVASGPVLRVIFSDFDKAAGRSIYKLRRASRKSLGAGLNASTTSNEEDAFEVMSVESVVSTQFRLQLPSIGITLINRQLEEVVYVFAKDVELRHAISNLHTTYGLTLGWLQIDNQLFGDWDHPILLYPAVIAKKHRSSEDTPPFLSVALIMSQDAAHGVTYIKYFGFLMQEVQVDLGEHLINKLVEFGQFESIAATDPRDTSLAVPEDRLIPALTSLDSESSLLYFELLQFHPMKVNLSFSKSEGPQYSETSDSFESREGSYNPFTAIANVFTTTLGSISDAPLRFNALILEHPIIRRNVLFSLIASHYSQQAVSQVHRIVGAADFIGNPVGLFSSFGSGVSDFFYEPFLGLVSDRPGDMGIGLAKGSVSLVRKTVYGLTDTFSKFTGSMSKGFTAATFDPSFQQKRRMIQSRNRPKHAFSGVTAGAKHLLTGLTSGLTGIVEKPVEGAKEGGIGGFFKGVGVGLVGIVTKPVVGVLDATTSLTEGIKNTADPDGVDLEQVRLPRAIPADGVIRPYSAHEARGQSILYAMHLRLHETATGFRLASWSEAAGGPREFYVAHTAVPHDKAAVLVTSLAIVLVEADDFKEIWRVPLGELVHVRPHRDIVLLVTRQDNEANRQRMLFLADPVEQEWFCARVDDAMAIYNEARHSS